jgi:multimeric flavodoxin WrbA
MKVVAFFGSPRVHGNTELLLDEALKPVREAGCEVQLFKLNFMNIKPCQNCGGCEKTGVCIIDDGMK